MEELPLATHSRTDRGLVHERNEDSSAVFDTPDGARVLLVCDGMGGMGRGDEASRAAVASIRRSLAEGDAAGTPVERMKAALRTADATVREELAIPGDTQPGSTAVMVWVASSVAWVAWVGDSRAYHVRGGAVVGRTRDHKLVEDLVDAGQMSAADARNSSLAHVVTRALGGKGPLDPEVTPAALPTSWKLRQGDHLLVCSDGLTDLVEDAELPDLVTLDDLEQASQRLVSLANERGGHDNITCVVARWDGEDWVGDGADAEETAEVDLPDTLPPEDAAATPPEPARVGRSTEGPDLADVGELARELQPWWIATAALLLCAVVFAIVAALGGG